MTQLLLFAEPESYSFYFFAILLTHHLLDEIVYCLPESLTILMQMRTLSPKEKELSSTSLTNGHLPRASVNLQLESNKLQSKSCALVVAKPIRRSLNNWSGGEDVMKVGLEMVGSFCNAHTFAHAGHELKIKKMSCFKRALRFRLMIYAPCVHADTDLEYVLTDVFDLPNLYRDIMKIIHLCANVKGTFTRRTLTPQSVAEPSDLLCGPVEVPNDNALGDFITLCKLLTAVLLSQLESSIDILLHARANDPLPTIQLATIYESFDELRASRIATYQNTFADKLRLSGTAYLGSLERAFEQNGILYAFTKLKPARAAAEEEEGIVRPRDETSRLYGRQAPQRHEMTQSSPSAWFEGRKPYHT